MVEPLVADPSQLLTGDSLALLGRIARSLGRRFGVDVRVAVLGRYDAPYVASVIAATPPTLASLCARIAPVADALAAGVPPDSVAYVAHPFAAGLLRSDAAAQLGLAPFRRLPAVYDAPALLDGGAFLRPALMVLVSVGDRYIRLESTVTGMLQSNGRGRASVGHSVVGATDTMRALLQTLQITLVETLPRRLSERVAAAVSTRPAVDAAGHSWAAAFAADDGAASRVVRVFGAAGRLAADFWGGLGRPSPALVRPGAAEASPTAVILGHADAANVALALDASLRLFLLRLRWRLAATQLLRVFRWVCVSCIAFALGLLIVRRWRAVQRRLERAKHLRDNAAEPPDTCHICLGGEADDDASAPAQPASEVGVPKWDVLLCGHQFHADCVRQWLRRRNTCPLCRCPDPGLHDLPRTPFECAWHTLHAAGRSTLSVARRFSLRSAALVAELGLEYGASVTGSLMWLRSFFRGSPAIARVVMPVAIDAGF